MSQMIFRFTKNNVVPGEKHKYKLVFDDTITLKNKQLALHSLILPYNWFNISTSLYNNAKFSYIWNGTAFDVTIPDGMYDFSMINEYFQEYVMHTNGH
jgi:membrane-associated PAP2 superfamily phosphatase